jgi:hypothetical protein
VLFLRALAAHGVILYSPARGRRRCACEAEALGYADLFQGRIYGAVGQVTREAKQIVWIDSSVRDPLARTEFVTFGDGPWKFVKTRLRGGLANRSGSDEIRRFELNTGKRSRLIWRVLSIFDCRFFPDERLLQLLRADAGKIAFL